MKRFKMIIAMVLSLSVFSNNAYAGCWMQCVGVSVNGNCIGAKTKVCNWEGWEDDIKDAGKALNDFTVNIEREWKDLYRRNLPENIRDVINTTTILFAGAYLLGVTPEGIGTVLAVIAGRAVIRSESGKKIHDDSRPWIADLEEKGNALVTSYETAIAITHKDAQHIFRREIDIRGIYSPIYLNCLKTSTSQAQAILDCFVPLEETLFNLKKEVTVQVLSSEI